MIDGNKLEEFISSELFEQIFASKTTRVSTPRKNYTLRGDSVRLEPINQEGKSYIKIHFPNEQIVKVPDGTKGTKVRYDSPTDGNKRMVHVAYINGRCRIEVPK